LAFPWSILGPEYRLVQLVHGFPQVEILPRPAAPDAVIFYTTDGSVPTSMSMMYTGPFSAQTGTNVRAISVWSAGTRTSPVTSYFVPTINSGLAVPLASGSDDGIETEGGDVILNGVQIEVGVQTAGFRFEGVRIPAGATVTQASIQFSSDRADSEATSLSVSAELAPDSAPFAGTEFEFLGRSKSNASAQWSVPSWTVTGQRGAGQRTPDLSQVLQEVIDSPGWQAGNAASFLMNSGTGARAAKAFENGAFDGAVLLLDYQLGSAFEIAAQTEITVSLNGTQGNGSIQVQFPRFKNSVERGLTYVLESSADLNAGSWASVTDPPSFVNPIGSTVFEYVSYLSLPYTELTQFFRLKVTGEVAQ
jgi:hypothetical protein